MENMFIMSMTFVTPLFLLQGWDFESIDTADSSNDSNKFEIEPMNEMVIGHNVHISSMVKSSMPDSFLWFAQVRKKRLKVTN